MLTTQQKQRIQNAINYNGSYKFPGPKNLYCGNLGCSERNDTNIIGRYCLDNNGVIRFRGSVGIKTPHNTQITDKYLAGYLSKHEGSGCGVTRRYIKDPKWGP